ncbi:MAG: hypothetical protein JST12_11955 [Armatimonadetes bacterium]|nr:hypothetical protein [Armatimonadota bacterium]MBS1725796.1 hypothetical protein [Armatimonadota bacterium]
MISRRGVLGFVACLCLAASCLAGVSKGIRLGVGDTSNVWLPGDQSNVKVASSDPLILEVTKAKSGFTAKGLRPGQGFVTVTQKGKDRRIDFAVKPYAAKIPGQITAEVSGEPAIPGTVQGAIEGSVKQQLTFAPLAKVAIKYEHVPSISPGKIVDVPIKLTVTAPGTLTKTGTLTVRVSNIGLKQKDEDALWYCNDPERVTKKENLFAAELKPKKSARMLYHHINDSSRDMVIRTMVVNDSDFPATICLTPGDSSPTTDPVAAGLRAGDLFLRAWVNDSGEVVNLPPRTCLPISCRRLKPKEVISGLCAIRYVDGEKKLLVRADAFPVEDLEPRWAPTLASSTPWREVGPMTVRSWDNTPYNISEHVYPEPFKAKSAEFSVGGRFAVIRLGQESIERSDNAGVLDGNFGVIYTIDATLSNPQEESTNIELVFEPSAGYSGGIFFIDDKYVITPKIATKGEARIARYRLYPGETRKIKILTMPLSGSSYPATLFVRIFGAGSASDIIDLTKRD